LLACGMITQCAGTLNLKLICFHKSTKSSHKYKDTTSANSSKEDVTNTKVQSVSHTTLIN